MPKNSDFKNYPRWSYFPRSSPAPMWASEFALAVARHRAEIDSADRRSIESDIVLAELRPSLVDLGWEIESGKRASQKIRRPVLFGDQNDPRVKYEIDGWHDEHGAVLEIESGRGFMGNAFYRDLIRGSLIHGARHLVIGLRNSYKYGGAGEGDDYAKGRDQLDAIYASGRLVLPFEGVLLFGW